jgi:hypothetical protein
VAREATRGVRDRRVDRVRAFRDATDVQLQASGLRFAERASPREPKLDRRALTTLVERAGFELGRCE